MTWAIAGDHAAVASVGSVASMLLKHVHMTRRTRRHSHHATLFMIGVATASCAAPARNQPPQETQFAQAVAPPQRLVPADPLPEVARENLRVHMAFHARDMNALVSDIMLLRYDQIEVSAKRIAGDASMSRPLTNDATELNSFFPEKFFLYQDNLRLEAKTLAESASRQSAFDVADSYGRLSQVCVRCHAAYRGAR